MHATFGFWSPMSISIAPGSLLPAIPAACALLIAAVLTPRMSAQTAFTWEQIKDKFESTNPTLRAGQLNIDESKAQEVTAAFRPNPDFSVAADGTQLTPHLGVYRPFAGTQISPS